MTKTREIVVENAMNSRLIGLLEVSNRRAIVTDVNAIMSARTLWRLVVQRKIIEHIQADVAKRNLLPVTIRTLCDLLFDAMKTFQ